MVNWAAQAPIMLFAAIFAIWWTGRQGLWDAVSGKTPLDKQWVDARAVLLRRIDRGKYEVMDGTNTRGDKRVLIMSYTRPPADGSPMPAPLVLAELVPIKHGSNGPYGKKSTYRGSGPGLGDRKKDKRNTGDRKPHKRNKGRGRGKAMEPIAKLVVFDPALDYLKTRFSKSRADDENLIEAFVDDAEEKGRGIDGGAGEGAGGGVGEGRAGAQSHAFEPDEM